MTHTVESQIIFHKNKKERFKFGDQFMTHHPLQCSCWRIPGTGSLVGCRLWGRIESDMTEAIQQQQQSFLNGKTVSLGLLSKTISIHFKYCICLSQRYQLEQTRSWPKHLKKKIWAVRWSWRILKSYDTFLRIQKATIMGRAMHTTKKHPNGPNVLALADTEALHKQEVMAKLNL